jgi:hypothetical protein
LQEIIDKLAKISTEGTTFMDEHTYITIDDDIKRTCILSFKEIAEFAISEEFENTRSHTKRTKDAKLNTKGCFSLTYICKYFYASGRKKFRINQDSKEDGSSENRNEKE